MIASFRASLDDWLQTTLTADIYVSATEDGGALSKLVASGALRELPGVDGLSLTRARVVPTAHGDVAIRAVQPGVRGWGLTLVAGDEVAAVRCAGTTARASSRRSASCSLAELRVGDELELPSPAGPRARADRRRVSRLQHRRAGSRDVARRAIGAIGATTS